MKTILWLLLLIPSLLAAQPNYEIREYTGVVKAIEPTWGLAYEGITLEVDGKLERYLFYTNYGKFILDNVKVNERITMRVKINLKARAGREERIKKFKEEVTTSESEIVDYFSKERITEILINGAWTPLPQPLKRIDGPPTWPPLHPVFLEKKVVDLYKRNGIIKAIVFENGLVATWSLPGLPPIRDIQVGDLLSFMGQPQPIEEGAVYPIAPVRQIYFFSRLLKNTGHIKSFLFKQNTVCIGVTMQTENSEIQVSFPSELATRVKDFLISGREVTYYYNDYKIEKNLDPRELHALVTGSDTLKIEKFLFYGGADGNHDYKPVTVSGKITRINRSDRGNMMSVIVGGDAYIEITFATAQQIEPFLKKGKEMEVTGDERIKKEGEIYQKEYRLITPKTIKLDGKEFLLK